MMMNRRMFSTALVAGAAASLISHPDEITRLILEAAGQQA